MEKRKYVTIDIDSEEENIGVIDLGIFDPDIKEHVASIEAVLVEALTEHFDAEIKVNKGAMVIKTHPLMIEFHVNIDGEYNELVTLNQTWLYKK